MSQDNVEVIKKLADSMVANFNQNHATHENTLGIIKHSLPEWKTMLNNNGYALVGVNVYLQAQLENAQRRRLKTEFEQHGFKYENIGEPLTHDDTLTNILSNNSSSVNVAQSGGSPYLSHPELDMRGTPLEKFYIDEEELNATNTHKADNRNDYQLSLRFSPSMAGPKLKDRVVYKPGIKPPAPAPRIDLRIRPR
jgi:hypothetical protein